MKNWNIHQNAGALHGRRGQNVLSCLKSLNLMMVEKPSDRRNIMSQKRKTQNILTWLDLHFLTCPNRNIRLLSNVPRIFSVRYITSAGTFGSLDATNPPALTSKAPCHQHCTRTPQLYRHGNQPWCRKPTFDLCRSKWLMHACMANGKRDNSHTPSVRHYATQVIFGNSSIHLWVLLFLASLDLIKDCKKVLMARLRRGRRNAIFPPCHSTKTDTLFVLQMGSFFTAN